MKKDSKLEKDEPIVIADECGDSMWDAVLQQEVKACDVKAVSNNASSLLNNINTAHPDSYRESDTIPIAIGT